MAVHPEFLELISTSLDRGISEDEQQRLDDHLWSCAACRDAGEQLQWQAAARVAMPAPSGSSAPSEETLLAALRRTTARQRLGVLAATVMVATIVTGLVTGFGLLAADEPDPSAGPSASLAAMISPSPSDLLETGAPTGSPSAATATAMATIRPTGGTRPPATQALAFPIAYDANLAGVRLAPTLDRRLWVSLERGPDTILALLDEAGEPVDGWPIELPFTQGCNPLAASDGSLRLLCNVSDVDPDHCLDICQAQVVLAFDGAGAELEGWPVSFGVAFERSVHAETARVVGDDVYLIESFGSEEFDPETGRYGSARLLRITPDGTVLYGEPVPGPEACCMISPDGVAFGRSSTYGDGEVPTGSLVAFDQSGVLPGWPVDFVGEVSMPGFGQDGALALATWGNSEVLSELRWVGRDGLPSPGAEVTLMDGAAEWDARWGGPMSPLVDDSDRAFVIVDGQIVAFGANGAPLPGWPYDPETAIRTEGGCGEGDTGCPFYVLLPVVDDGPLYVLETGERENGGRVTAVQADGSIRGDWPVILKRPGATFDSIVLSESGLAFAVAREPESAGATSSTILAITEDGNVRYATTVLQP
jgi:hypothetical protein